MTAECECWTDVERVKRGTYCSACTREITESLRDLDQRHIAKLNAHRVRLLDNMRPGPNRDRAIAVIDREIQRVQAMSQAA